jgi:hypothetical protein
MIVALTVVGIADHGLRLAHLEVIAVAGSAPVVWAIVDEMVVIEDLAPHLVVPDKELLADVATGCSTVLLLLLRSYDQLGL